MEKPTGFEENRKVAQEGGAVAGNARKDLERRLGHSLITKRNASELNHVITQMIEASATAVENKSDE